MVGGVLVAVFARREREPEYGGKRLSEWVEGFAIFDLRFSIGKKETMDEIFNRRERKERNATQTLGLVQRWRLEK